MRLAISALLCGYVLAAAGCSYTRQYAPPVADAPLIVEPLSSFDEPGLQAANKPGHAIIRGQAFSKTVGGDVKYGAGNQILLMPKTPYTSECLNIIINNQSGCTSKIQPYVRHVQADGEGRFEFDDIAPGTYLVTTIITWGVPGPYGIRETGGPVTTTAEVSSDTDIVAVNLN